MPEGDIEQVRAQADRVCAEAEEFESAVRGTSTEAAALDDQRLAELRGQCELLHSKVVGMMEQEQAAGARGTSALLDALTRAKERLDALIAARRSSLHEPRFSGVAGVDKAASRDSVCTDERDSDEPPDPGELEGSMINVGAAMAGVMPLQEPPAPFAPEEVGSRPEKRGSDDSETCNNC